MTNQIEVLNPIVEPISQGNIVANRPDSLDGKVLGLLANGKRNSEEILDMIKDVLSDRYEFKNVIARNKGNASRPCPDDMVTEMVDLCDVIITSSGD